MDTDTDQPATPSPAAASRALTEEIVRESERNAKQWSVYLCNKPERQHVPFS